MNRRQTLHLIAGAVIGGSGLAVSRLALAEPGSFRLMTGEVRVGGQPALEGTILKPGDKISTGPGASAAFVVGDDAFLLREDTLVELGVSKGPTTCRIDRGGVLFSIASDRLFRTTAASFDIRTGAGYFEIKGGDSYFCLCYGDGVLVPVSAPNQRNAFLSDHHDRSVLLRAGKKAQEAMVTAQLRGHTDTEIAALDALVGRAPPFAAKG